MADRQWHAARRGANAAGVELAGDIPFMVAPDSADVWARRHDFRLDARVGVPPDAFSATGQDWGLPVYRWAEMEAAGHQWINARASRMADLYGLYRVDHVVGLYRTYYFPTDGAPPAFIAVRGAGPDRQRRAGAGHLLAGGPGSSPRTSAWCRPSSAPRWIGWPSPATGCSAGSGTDHAAGQPFRDPAGWPAISVATTGTHDTDSVADWYEGLSDGGADRLPGPAGPGVRSRARATARFDEAVRDAILEMLYGAGSDLAAPALPGLLRRPGAGQRARHRDRPELDLPAAVGLAAAGRRLSPSRDRLRSLAARHGRAAPRP